MDSISSRLVSNGCVTPDDDPRGILKIDTNIDNIKELD